MAYRSEYRWSMGDGQRSYGDWKGSGGFATGVIVITGLLYPVFLCAVRHARRWCARDVTSVVSPSIDQRVLEISSMMVSRFLGVGDQ